MAIIDGEARGRHTETRLSADRNPNRRERDWRNDTVLPHGHGAPDRPRWEATIAPNMASTTHTESSLWAIAQHAVPMSATNEDARQAAAAPWRESSAAGTPLTGAQLGARFDRSARWGRDVIASCRTAPADMPPAAAGTER
jgi:hypothetical protein